MHTLIAFFVALTISSAVLAEDGTGLAISFMASDWQAAKTEHAKQSDAIKAQAAARGLLCSSGTIGQIDNALVDIVNIYLDRTLGYIQNLNDSGFTLKKDSLALEYDRYKDLGIASLVTSHCGTSVTPDPGTVSLITSNFGIAKNELAKITPPSKGGYCDLVGTFIFAQDKGSNIRGTYLGLISDNPYLTESIMNKYGAFGSKYSSTSILNEYGNFGSKYSSSSPYNKFSSSPPIIWSYNSTTQVFTPVAYLTVNTSLSGSVADPNVLLTTLVKGCTGGFVPPVITKSDLIIDSLVAFISPGKDSIHVSYVVANVGTQPTPNFSVSILVSGNVLPKQNFQPLNPLKYFAGSFSQKVTRDTTGILIYADVDSSVVEDNENNNYGIGIYLTPVPTHIGDWRAKRISPFANYSKGYDVLGRNQDADYFNGKQKLFRNQLLEIEKTKSPKK